MAEDSEMRQAQDQSSKGTISTKRPSTKDFVTTAKTQEINIEKSGLSRKTLL